jgi:hypothetical protein
MQTLLHFEAGKLGAVSAALADSSKFARSKGEAEMTQHKNFLRTPPNFREHLQSLLEVPKAQGNAACTQCTCARAVLARRDRTTTTLPTAHMYYMPKQQQKLNSSVSNPHFLVSNARLPIS